MSRPSSSSRASRRIRRSKRFWTGSRLRPRESAAAAAPQRGHRGIRRAVVRARQRGGDSVDTARPADWRTPVARRRRRILDAVGGVGGGGGGLGVVLVADVVLRLLLL